MIIGGCAIAIVLLGVVGWVILINRGTSNGKPPTITDGSRLVVSRDPAKGDFFSVRDALRKAKPKDHIVLGEGVYEELLDRIDKSDITIEAETGKEVVVRYPEKMEAGKYLLFVSQVARIRFRGLTLDGGNKADQVVVLAGKTPGLTLEDLTIRGFKENGMLLVGCSGSAELPVSVLRVETQTATPAKAAIAFRSGRKSEPNEYITIRDCRFNGPYQSPVLIQDGSKIPNVIFEGNQPPAPGEAPVK
jgi:hypothetical protein